jgi:hypothetical protein
VLLRILQPLLVVIAEAQSDSKKRPYASPAAAHGTGAVHPGTPQTTIADLSARGLYHQRTAYIVD